MSDDTLVQELGHVRSPFQLNPLKLIPLSNSSNDIESLTDGSDTSSPKSIISPSPFSLSIKKIGGIGLTSTTSSTPLSPNAQQKISDLQKEIVTLKKDIEAKDTKLSSSLKSIKQFWSPELKKERASRKEETEKCILLKEQYTIASTQIQEYKTTLVDLESELNSQQKQISVLEDKLVESSKTIKTNEEEIAGLSKERAHLEDEVHVLTMLREEEERKLLLNDCSKRLDNDDEDVVALKKQLTSQTDEIVQLKIKVACQEDEMVSMNEHSNSQGSEVQLLTGALNDIKHKYAILEEECDEKNKCISDLEIILVDKERKEQQLDVVSAELEVLYKALRSQENEYLKLKVKLEDSEVERSSLLTSQEIAKVESSQADESLKLQLSELKVNIKEKEDLLSTSLKEMKELQGKGNINLEKINQLDDLLCSKDNKIEELHLQLKLLAEKCEESERRIYEKPSHEDVRRLEAEVQSKENQLGMITEELKCAQEKLTNINQLTSNPSQSEQVNDLAAARSKSKVFQKKFKDSQQLVAKKTKELTEAAEKLSSMEKNMAKKEKEYNEKFDNLQKYVEDREKALEHSRVEVKELKALQSSLDIANQKLQDDLFEQKSLLGRMEKQNEMQSVKTVSIVVYEDVKHQCELVMIDRDNLVASIEDFKSDIKCRDKTVNELENIVKDLQATAKSKEEKFIEVEKDRSSLQEELQSAKLKLDEKQRSRSEEKVKEQQTTKRLWDDTDKKALRIDELERQLKEKSKQLNNLKKSQNVDKDKQHQLMNDKAKNEADWKKQLTLLQDEQSKRDERIAVLEDALRESVNIAAEREEILASHEEMSEETAKGMLQLEEEIGRVAVEKAVTNIKNAFLILSLGERDALIASMKATRRRQTEEMHNVKVEGLLASISEKDTQIAQLEMSTSRTKRQEIKHTKVEKEKLVTELKEQNNNRIQTVSNETTNDIITELKDAPSEQVYEAIRHLSKGAMRLEFYIEELMTFLKEKNVEVLTGIEGTPKKSSRSLTKEDKLTKAELLKELRLVNGDSVNLKKYVEGLLTKLEGG